MTVLRIMLGPLRGRGERRAPGFGSRSPGRDNVIVAMDYRSTSDVCGPDDEDNPPRSILRTLHHLSRRIRVEQDVREPLSEPTIVSEVGYLLGGVEWCSHQPWVAAIVDDIRELHAQCRRLAGDQPGRPIGRCPTLLPTGECRMPLYVPSVGDSIICHNPRCGRTWRRPEWERLALLLTTRATPTHVRRAA
ncbi:hypothetical protein BC739_003110 [Kutzneria viridogrisea]|uniref:Uncharacterized protein n=1 Tax=Kutzneria viridogrisea TaxID=47990 RepID=A0ABR6BGU4_9PSEU|nr:hypothetical protein [Kutzneria viridogrisea]